MAEDHIKIDDIPPEVRYTVGSVAQSQFDVPFAFFANADLRVFIDDTALTLGADYTVSGEGNSDGGTVTLTASVTNTTVVIWRRVPIERVTDFPSSGPFRIASLNTEFDRHVAIMQQLADDQRRSLQQPEGEATVSMTLPSAVERAGRFLGFDGTGRPVAVGGSTDLTVDLSDRTVRSTGASVARSLKDKLSDVVSAKDFGVEGDGVADDTDAFQAAVLSGQPLRLQKGTIRITKTILIPAGARLIGVNTPDAWDGTSEGTTILVSGSGNPARWTDIDGTDAADFTPALVLAGNDIRIEHLTVKCTVNSRWSAGIYVAGTKRCKLVNVDTMGPWTKAGLYLDATWSSVNETLKDLHPEIQPSAGLNEFSADDGFFEGLWGVLCQGTTRNPDDYMTSEWMWAPGGTSDMSFYNCRMGSCGDIPVAERQADGGCFKHDAAMKNSAGTGQGHNFVNCSFRTKSKYLIYLDRSTRDTFVNCYGETQGSNDTGATAITALTSNTGTVFCINDNINGPIYFDGVQVSESLSAYRWSSTRRLSVIRVNGRVALPNLYAGMGNNIIPELISGSINAEFRFCEDDGSSEVVPYLRVSKASIRPETSGGIGLGTTTYPFGVENITELRVVSICRATADNAVDLGTSSFRWATVRAGTGTINTSDAREKTWRGSLNEAELRVATRLSRLIGIYQWNAMVTAKGSGGARLHAGVTAQDVKAAFEAEGLDGFRYGVLCHDEWSDEVDGDGILLAAAGDRFGVRYDELAMWLAAGFEARLSALENF